MRGYVYVKSEPALWTVGFHDPAGEWITDSDFGTQEEAAQRVRWLNGGPDLVDMAADEQTQIEVQHETGQPGRFKLYIHHKGRTIVRVCKLKADQIRNQTSIDFLATTY